MKSMKFIKFGPISKKLILLSLQIACLLSILGLGIISHSQHLYQIQMATFAMQTAIVLIGEGFLFGAVIEKVMQ